MKDLTSSIYTFEELINGQYLYVDKTEYIWQLIRPYKGIYFMSRPRRFGKSLTVSTLKAVFQGRRDLFNGLAIDDKDYDWKQYPVIHLDLNGWNFASLEELKRSLCGLIQEAAEDHDVQLDATEPNAMFRELIRALSKEEQVVILLDEYDKPILNNIGKAHAPAILEYLKSFYSVIKAFEGYLRFAFVTGVSKFSHVSIFSDLNNLSDITMNADYASMLGYTQAELESCFAERIADGAKKVNKPVAELLEQIKSWYDGYRFEESSESVYNPVSVAQFFLNNCKFNNYWFSTGTPSFLIELIKTTRFDFGEGLEQTSVRSGLRCL